MDKIAKIWSQPAKYNVFCGTEASSIISSVTRYRITKNWDHHPRCSLLITIYYYLNLEQNVTYIVAHVATGYSRSLVNPYGCIRVHFFS